jgi:branched-chain amino acid transport system permease protein
MTNFRSTAHNYVPLFLIPLWVGLLALPFTGLGNAVRLAAAAVIAILVWKSFNSETIMAARAAAAVRLSKVVATISPFTRYAYSPLTYALVIVFLIVLPLVLNDYHCEIMTLTGMYIVLALGLNLVVGQAGLLHLGYAAFYAVGAYTYAILSTTVGLSFWPGLAAGGFVAAVFAVLLGLPTLRLRGDYFAIVTLGLGEITRIILNNWDSMTGGPNGIAKIGRPVLAGYELHTSRDFYYLMTVIVVITVFAMHRLITSRTGRAWIAIREDEIAAEAMGINTFKLKLLAFVLGSAWAGIVGVFFAAKMAFVSPESFTFFESVMILCMVVLGGMGSIPGIILGALLLITLPEIFREFQDYRMLAFGFALVVMMVFRPQGLLGVVKKQGSQPG